MKTKRVLILFATTALLFAALAPDALAGAGGGSSGFSGGGGGGHGSGFAIYIVFQLLFHIALLGHGLGALVLLALALLYLFVTRVMPKMQESWAMRTAAGGGTRTARRKSSGRERQVELAAAEAADEDPDFAPDQVRSTARELFLEIEKAWDADDRGRLHTLVGPDLMVEWERRLDDFSRRGWRNRVEPIGEPTVEYVGLNRTGNDATDHVVVRIDARLKDYVVDDYGRHLKRVGKLGEMTRVHEFWTLGRRNLGGAANGGAAGRRWVLLSIEQGAEGKHALNEQVVATPWGDETALRDEAMVEAAVAEAVPEGTKVAEVADLQFDGDAQSAANDLSLADGRFAPDVLEIAARRAVAAWAQAVDGDEALLSGVATPAVARELLYGGDPSGRRRIVVRGPVVNRIRIVGLDAGAEPPTMTVEVDLSGRRYVEDRDTTAVLAGSRSRSTSFTERWTLSLTGSDSQPWQITAVAAPVGLA